MNPDVQPVEDAVMESYATRAVEPAFGADASSPPNLRHGRLTLGEERPQQRQRTP